MDFFSKLGKKASQTYQVTKEKAANLSEELKLKGKISDLKDKIDDIYNEIGKKVYNELNEGKDVSKDEIMVKCEEISKLKDNIEKLQSDILALKKVRKCSNCGEELDFEDVFCCKCGTKQPEIEKVEVNEKPAEGAKETVIVEIAETTTDVNVESTENNDNAPQNDNNENNDNNNENNNNDNCDNNNNNENDEENK